MTTLLELTVVGLVTGCIYSLIAMGIVVTYTVSGIFNFAQGAIGMLGAFLFWQFEVDMGWPGWAALLLVVGVIAPALGALTERFLIRRVTGGAVDTTITLTLGLTLGLIGVATIIWNPDVERSVPQFFGLRSVDVFGVNVTWDQITIVLTTIVVAIALRLLLFSTSVGTSMRAVVDNRDLAAMAGASTARYSRYGWMIGASLGALGGILLAPLVELNQSSLTLIVINCFAAAMVGRLRNLPLTFAGGLGLGLLESYAIGYLPLGQLLSQIQPAVPMVFLFVVLLALPDVRLRISGGATLRKAPRLPSFRASLGFGALLVVVVYVVSAGLSGANVATVSHGVAVAFILLSLVLLTGYSGQVCLCVMTFAGLGAFAMANVGGGGSWFGLLAAAGLAGAVGVIVALPAIRLRGLYLALTTLAFAQAMDFVFFQNLSILNSSGAIVVGRVYLFSVSLEGARAYLIFLTVLFAIASIGIVSIRRSSFGRRLAAMHDSPAGSASLGINLTRTKVLVFAMAAALAGIGGALYAGGQGQVTDDDFALLVSLTLLLLAIVFGIRTVSGAFVAGIMFAVFPLIQSDIPALRSLSYVLTGVAAIGIGQNPDGIFGGVTPIEWFQRRRQGSMLAQGPATQSST
jgi:branched-chain amino acid transport system permease protein